MARELFSSPKNQLSIVYEINLQKFILYCTILHCISQYCIVLHCIALYFIVSHCIALLCISECYNWTMKSKRQNIWQKLRRVIFETSHLAPYLPLIIESKQQKIARIYEDKSFPNINNDQDTLSDHFTGHKKKNILETILFNRRPCFYPCSNWLLAWYIINFLGIMYYFIEATLMATYGPVAWNDEKNNGGAMFLNVFFIIVYGVDIFIQFSTGYLYRGMIIMDRERVVGRYLHSLFIPDIILFLILIISIASGWFNTNYAKLLVFYKFARMFQLDEFILRRLSVHRFRKTLYVIGKQMITIFVLSHIIGLIFYLMDLQIVQNGVCQMNNDLCWLYSSTAYSPIISYDWELQYFYTLYWGVNTITTISYGDIAPNNPQQVVYALAMMCFGFIVYGYVTNSIIQVVLWARTLKDKLRTQTMIMDTYMDNLGINIEIQGQVRDYLQFLHLEQKNRNLQLEEQMKEKLPEQLRCELVRNAYSKVGEGLEFMLQSGTSVTRLLFFLRQKKFTSHQQVLAQGCMVNQLHYLHKGEVNLSCSVNHIQPHKLTSITTIDQFLSLYQFFLNEPSTLSITAEKGSIFYFISADHFHQQAAINGVLKEMLKLVEYQVRFNTNLKKIFYYCYLCGKNHHWQKCSQHFPDFNNTTLSRYNLAQDIVRVRVTPVRHNVLINRDRLKQLQVFQKSLKDKIVSKIDKRLRRIRQKIQENKILFEVDMAYDWNNYLPHHNISRLKEQWNTKKQTRRISLFSAFRSLAR